VSTDSTRITATVRDLRKAEKRRDSRKRVLWKAALETARGRIDCQILNISPGGARVHARDALGLNNPVTLIIGDIGEFHGVVAWEEGGHSGIKFTAEDLSKGANRDASRRNRAGDATVEGRLAAGADFIGPAEDASRDGAATDLANAAGAGGKDGCRRRSRCLALAQRTGERTADARS